nr:hypothetical protein [Tanacetum cinerariifolium]
MQQPMPNPEDITDPTTAMNMELALMAKAFKLNYSKPTNNNQRISSNPCNRQIAQPGNLNGYNAVQNVRNQDDQNAIQNLRIQNAGNQSPNGNGNLVAERAECNATGPRKRDAAYLQTQLLIAQKKEAGIQLQTEEFDLMAAAADLDEIEEVNANCILMANLQQASTSGTQTDKAPVYNSDGSAEVHNYEDCYNNEIFNMFTQEEQYTELFELISESHQVSQNDNNVISEVTSMEQSGETVEQHPANAKETRVLYDSLYHNLAIEVEKEKKAKLFNEWERFTSNEGESIECYYHRFLKLMNDLKRNKHFLEKIASNLKFLNNLQPEWSRHNFLQQPMTNPKDITDPTTAMNMALALMAKAFKLNYSTPTNNNQRISSNPRNRQIAQPGMNMGQDRQMQMIGVAQNPRVQNDEVHNQIGNGNLVAVRAEGNAAGHNGNQIRCYNCRGVGHFARDCTVRPRRRDAAYLQTHLLIAHKEEAGI